MKILVINGPNLNLLGTRQPEIYGHETLSMIEEKISQSVVGENIELSFFQSNHEGFLIDKIQESVNEKVDWIIINPGAYGHTSIAIRDAFLGVGIPFIEVHISNISEREHFRKNSYLSDIAKAVIVGYGTNGYLLALKTILEKKIENF